MHHVRIAVLFWSTTEIKLLMSEIRAINYYYSSNNTMTFVPCIYTCAVVARYKVESLNYQQ